MGGVLPRRGCFLRLGAQSHREHEHSILLECNRVTFKNSLYEPSLSRMLCQLANPVEKLLC